MGEGFFLGFEKRAAQTTFGLKPLVITKDGKLILYHGTPVSTHRKIDKEGLKVGTRRNVASDPSNMGRTHSKLIHLTPDPVYAYAFSSYNKNSTEVPPEKRRIYKVELDSSYNNNLKRKNDEGTGAFGGMYTSAAFVTDKDIPKKYITKMTLNEAYNNLGMILSEAGTNTVNMGAGDKQ